MELLAIVRERLSERRAAHTVRCAECARTLAARFHADEDAAYTAGLLHDITKELSAENQLKLCEKHDIILDNVSRENPALLHAITGAFVAEHEFHASPAICHAILYHTTGCAQMSDLDKCLWLADFIEPGRNFPELPEVRALAEENLDRAVLAGLDYTILYLIEKKRMIHPAILDARNDILRSQR